MLRDLTSMPHGGQHAMLPTCMRMLTHMPCHAMPCLLPTASMHTQSSAHPQAQVGYFCWHKQSTQLAQQLLKVQASDTMLRVSWLGQEF